MRNTGFTLIEMVLYIALFSILGTLVSTLYIQTQRFFLDTNVRVHRYVVQRYITVTVESKVDMLDYNCLSAHESVYCDNILVLKPTDFERIGFVGVVSDVEYVIQQDILYVQYVVTIGKKKFNEQLKIFLI